MVDLLLQLGLALEQLVHLVVRHRLGELVVDLVEFVEQIDRSCTPSSTIWRTVLVVVQRRLLLQVAHGVARREDGLAEESLSTPAMILQQRAFARAVEAEHADLRAVEIGQVDVLEDRLFVVALLTPIME